MRSSVICMLRPPQSVQRASMRVPTVFAGELKGVGMALPLLLVWLASSRSGVDGAIWLLVNNTLHLLPMAAKEHKEGQHYSDAQAPVPQHSSEYLDVETHSEVFCFRFMGAVFSDGRVHG